jgi:cysteine-S-conjugate beta-lyase
MHQILGIGTAPEDAWLILRGLRTMALRMAHQDQVARQLAIWLEARPEVAAVLHPALPSHPDYNIWLRDFTGAGGLFSIVLNPASEAKVHAMVEAYSIFSIGFSWGGYESLVICHTNPIRRDHPKTYPDGPVVRYSIGLEAIEDLIGDLERGFDALAG